MTRIATLGWDMGHCSTWVVDAERAVSLSPENPEYAYYGHLDALLNELACVETVVVTEPWSPKSLGDIDAVVLPHPSHPEVQKGYPGTPAFTNGEIEAMKGFVSAGGGLFVIGEYSPSHWRVNTNDVLAPLGIQFDENQLSVLRGRDAHVMSRHFSCTSISDHEATFGVSRITYHRGASVSFDSGAVPLISAPNGQCVVAARRFGRGRVVAIGDSDLFALPFVGHADNARLFANLACWVSGQTVGDEIHARVRAAIGDLTGELFHPGIPPQLSRAKGIVVQVSAFPEIPSAARDVDPYQATHVDEFLEEARLWYDGLPERVRRSCRRFRRKSNRSGVLLLRGLSPGNLPATPLDSRPPAERTDYMPEFYLAAFGEMLGDTISYSQEKDGELFHCISPTKANETKLSSESSRGILDFHTETAFHPFMPDYVLLFCLRPDHDRAARTFVAGVRNILPLLTLRTRAVLFEERFRTGVDFSFGSPSGKKANGPPTAILFGEPYDPFMKYDLDLMSGMDSEADGVLMEMKRVANFCKQDVRLREGDLLIVDNRRTVHGRSEFVPRYDGRDRWLMRTYVVRDMALSEEERLRDQRILDTEFAL